ncbi:ABC transporter substrate-binding protein [Microbacterium fluvii]|uniref:ABC transporter substrate-binding protein n=1 Tax=Microbacterium fluvii TaxID=415215 RepID=A0ABW2HF00_9MICO|nr:ABC transporter substrate-binding protein [Microbacterium fluvii]MCU4673101.1 ABC transporter substrate-binding protein [Microbacterium fluvii]
MSTTHRYRTAALAVLAAASVAVVTGCASTASAPAADSTEGTPVAGGELTVEFWPDNAAFACVDPFQTYWIEHRQVIRNFADSLTDQDPDTGEIVPWLATDWTVSDDGLTYTFDLRDDVTFSDGTAFTADSVVLALDSAAQTIKDVPGAYGGVYIAGYESSTAVDADTVEVHFATPNAAFLQGTSTTNLAILAASSYEATPEERCLGDVVGSGSFVLDSYTPGEGIELSKRDGYNWASDLNAHQGEAYLDAIHIHYVAEDSVRTGNLASGASDIAWPRNPFTPEDAALLTSAGATIESRSLPGPSYAFYPNVSGDKPLSDPLVRDALQKAIDRETYAATIYGDDYPVVEGAFNSTTPFFVSEADQLAYDPEGAAQLLDEAGWTLEEGADYRTKDGETLTLVEPITAETPGDVLLQDQLKQVGIKLDLSVYQAAERASIITNGDYDLLATYYTRADPGVLQWILDDRYAGSKEFAANAQSPETAQQVKDLFDAGLETTNTDERAAVYAELQELLISDGVSFPVFERVQQAATAGDVHGFRFTSESFLSYYDIWKDAA